MRHTDGPQPDGCGFGLTVAIGIVSYIIVNWLRSF